VLRWLPGLSGYATAISICFGVVLGTGGYTFYYAEGASYLSNDPAACTNCHVMNPYFDGWQKASRHHVAVCNDCHLPHGNMAEKYLAKADAGFRHSWAFTFEDFHEPIEMIPRSARILEHNCIRCHEMVVHDQLVSAAQLGGGMDCVACHRSVGHGPTR